MEPQPATISGIEVVTIPLADYAALLACKARLAELDANLLQLSAPRKGIIDRNPEVAVFLATRFGTLPVSVVLKQCRRTFGAARTPSRSAAYRYWQRIRNANRKRFKTP